MLNFEQITTRVDSCPYSEILDYPKTLARDKFPTHLSHKEKVSLRLQLRQYPQHFIFVATYEWVQYARTFDPGRSVQPSLTFPSKAGAYSSKAPSRCSTLG
jgi:hypothetical protein